MSGAIWAAPLGRALAGQILMMICCAFYIAWWSRSYKPGAMVSKTTGFSGVLLLVAALSGIAGLTLTIIGTEGMTGSRSQLSSPEIALFGAAAYVALLLLTVLVFRRKLTTELLLIVAWATLEAVLLNALYRAEYFSTSHSIVMSVLLIAALLISLVLYVVYYRVDKGKAYYLAMLPLVTEGAVMLLIVLAVLL